MQKAETGLYVTRHSEFEYLFMRFAVFWITDGKFNDRNDYTSKRYAIMLFYFLSFNKPELTSLIVDLSTKTNLEDCEHVFVQWATHKKFKLDHVEKLRKD